jgi:hypothetical protein
MQMVDHNVRIWLDKRPMRILILHTNFSVEIYEKREDGTTGELILQTFREGVKMCSALGRLFKDVPGYVKGYGCPICKGLSYHLPLEEP